MADSVETLKARLRDDLRMAMQTRSAAETKLLRALIAALDNAQAIPLGERHDRYVELRFGDRSAEAPRRILSDADLDRLLQREIQERQDAAQTFDRLGQTERASAMRNEAAIVARYGRDDAETPYAITSRS